MRIPKSIALPLIAFARKRTADLDKQKRRQDFSGAVFEFWDICGAYPQRLPKILGFALIRPVCRDSACAFAPMN
jgi:hypothetical protein